MRKRTGTQFNCFSPPVMVATIVIELALASYTVMRYKLNELGRLIFLTLICLAGFQIAEFNVCTSANQAEFWSRLGFAFITALPPLGVHLMYVLSGKRGRKVVTAAYATMVAYMAVYLLMPNVFDSYQCTGNYVTFHLREYLGGTYWVYYFGWMAWGIGQGVRRLGDIKRDTKTAIQQVKNVEALIIGWLVFVLPTAAINIADPQTMSGIPSIMCGFAVLYALILVLYILPRAGIKKTGVKKT